MIGLGMGAARSRMIAETKGARLAAVCDLVENKAREVAARHNCEYATDYRRILDRKDVDVVFVLTPSGLHAPIALDALAAGKHVIVTKPMEVTLEKADAMIAAAEKAGRMLAVDFETRYSETSWTIKNAIDDGVFGRLLLGETRLKWYRSQQYYDAGGWRGTWKMDGGGSLANQTIHNIDRLIWFMGDVRTVRGKTGILNHRIETEDIGLAWLEFRNGAWGTILGTTTFPRDAYWGEEIHGELAGILTTREGPPAWFFRDEKDRSRLRSDRPCRNVVEDVLRHLLEGKPLLVDGREGRRSLELLTAIYESAREGREIELPSRPAGGG